MSTSGSKSNEHVAHCLVDIHSQRVESPDTVPIHFNHNPFFTLNRWARHAKVELSSAAGFSGLSVPQIGAGRKNWKDETFF